MEFFQYGQEEINYLKSKDKKLARKIDEIGLIKRSVNPDLFSNIIYSIISQQISTKAADTIKERFINTFKTINPENLYYADINLIQKQGLSFRKAEYIKAIARDVYKKELDLNGLYSLTDEEVIEELVKLKGIGQWTAQMLMIFSMQRMNVISYLDLGIRRGIMTLYGHKELTKERFDVYRKRYNPYASVASLYLWEIGKN